MVQTQAAQPIPGSPASEAGSRLSTFSTDSEIRNLQVIARAQAMFDFAGEDEGDLAFKVGDIINVIAYLNDDWWRGTLRKDVGIFPTAYVQRLPPTTGKYPTVAVSVRHSVLGAPLADQGQQEPQPQPQPQQQPQQQQQQQPVAQESAGSSALQAQPSFRASYLPSGMGGPNEVPVSTPPTTPPSIGGQGFQPMLAPGQGPIAPESVSGGAFPTPPPPPASSQGAPPSVFTYFPGAGNQPPISPPPSMRAGQRLPFSPNGQGSPTDGSVASPVSSQQRFGPGGPIQYQQAPFQQQQQGFPQQFQQGGYGSPAFQQPFTPQTTGQGPSSPTSPVGANSQLTTKQMAAAVKSKKKFGSKW
ncbi:ESCRT-0 subunit protein hse1 [Haplosporangium bisporale]|nr:ESCRT-0 subunit protein hse1 [Haplosporangium bisporale]